jgi:hypothetical protein
MWWLSATVVGDFCWLRAARLTLNKTKKVAHVKTAQEASNYIRALKRRSAEYT